ncbi:MAG: MoaD/ThiS family protein [Chitinophagaceae bacterium]
MQVTVLLFGQLTDITGTNKLVLENIADTHTLARQLQSRYPALQPAHYLIAVNKQLVQENTMLQDGIEVALLPPYSGG